MNTRKRKIRTAVVLGFFAVFVFLFGFEALYSILEYRESLAYSEISGGVYLRMGEDRSWAAIRYGSPLSRGGYPISPQTNLGIFAFALPGADSIHNDDNPNLVLTERDSVWMREICGTYAVHQYTNPKLVAFERLLLEAIEAGDKRYPDCDRLNSIAAASVVFFGYAVRNEDDLKLLKQERYRRTAENVKQDIVMEDGRTLYVIHKGVELEMMSPDSDKTAEEIRALIPILVENPNVDFGHPLDELFVYYLDGTVEVIPFGERFPATQALIDFLKPE